MTAAIEQKPSHKGLEQSVTIGVLALQGAFEEHRKMFENLGVRNIIEIRLPQQLDSTIDGLVIPGGESTAMAVVGERTGIFPKIREYVNTGKPVWGTCAGMILLANEALMQKEGGQPLVGGLNVGVCRNFFGSQVSSFEVPLEVEGPKTPGCVLSSGPRAGVFIRAPAILTVGEGVEVLAKVHAEPCEAAKRWIHEARVKNGNGGDDTIGVMEVVVAVQQGNILATAFHPELTEDHAWHEHFLQRVIGAVINPPPSSST